MSTIKIKYNIWDEVETLFGDQGYIYQINIWKNLIQYNVRLKDHKYVYLEDHQIKKSKNRNIGFSVKLWTLDKKH